MNLNVFAKSLQYMRQKRPETFLIIRLIYVAWIGPAHVRKAKTLYFLFAECDACSDETQSEEELSKVGGFFQLY